MKINILGFPYEIKLDKIRNLSGNVGHIYFDDNRLEIAEDVPTEVMYSTLLHEIIEAINYHLELELTHSQICAIEVGVHQTLVDGGVNLSP